MVNPVGSGPTGDDVPKVIISDSSGNLINSLGNALNVHTADVHNIIINRHFINYDAATENPSVAINAGDFLIEVNSTTGFSVGDNIVIKDANENIREHPFVITAVVVDTSITVDRPIDIDIQRVRHWKKLSLI